jgi:hypothetical protein
MATREKTCLGGTMHLFVLDSCKIYAQLLPGTKNVRRSEGFKIIRRKVIWEHPPPRLSISSSGARSRVRDVYLWQAICALESAVRFKRVSTKYALSSLGGEGFGLPNAEKLGVRGG